MTKTAVSSGTTAAWRRTARPGSKNGSAAADFVLSGAAFGS
eukprot:SAG31_NODE_27083_length_431_cov_1.861446_1_plen_40_part_01